MDYRISNSDLPMISRNRMSLPAMVLIAVISALVLTSPTGWNQGGSIPEPSLETFVFSSPPT